MVVRNTKQGYYWSSMYRDAAKVIQDCEKCKEQSAIMKAAENGVITAGNRWSFSHWGVNILGSLPTAPGGLKFLALAVEHSTKWVEEKPLTTINGKHAERFVWEYIETPFSLTYGYEAIIPIAGNVVAKDDRGRTKEATKIKESKEVASIEEAHYQNKLRMYHNEKSNHSTYKIGDFVLLLQNDA
ncbi:reverse transcriptase domain-containing protein [Tanacetum coccineum]